MVGLVLLVPEKADIERDAVAVAWTRAGGSVVRVGRFWDPPSADRSKARVYGGDTFCLVLAQKLGLRLISPPDRLLADVPSALLRRRLRVSTLEDVRAADFPAFVKPLVPKQFRGSVYETLAALSQETEGLAPDTAVFVSDVVSLEAEARAFVLDGRVLDCAVYEGLGDPSEAASFVRAVLAAVELPRTCVVDVGRLPGGEWAVVEFNATWGSGLNGCNATHVIEAIAAASEPDS